MSTAPPASSTDRGPLPRTSPSYRLRTWALGHLQALFSTLGRLARSPSSTVLTSAVIGVALALPAGLYAVLDNARQVTERWEGSAQVSVFLKRDLSRAEAEATAARVRQEPAVETVTVIDPPAALEEYRQMAGLGEVVEALGRENPLPHLLEVRLRPGGGPAAESLVERLSRGANVDFARYDRRWLRRLQAMMDLARHGVTVLCGVLGLGVVLIVGNTIRLALDARREEIAISRLFGATDGFVRRPFLYTGAWYGLLGGIIGWMLLEIAMLALAEPVAGLAALYASDFRLAPLGLAESGALLGVGTVLGLAGAWTAVGYHLRMIESD